MKASEFPPPVVFSCMVHQVQYNQLDNHLDLGKYHLRTSPIELFCHAGCSKTLMARALATEGKMNFLAVKGPELLSKWLGESERALASLFRRARDAAPSICFFDEIDAIAGARGDINSGGGRLLSQLLTELDGIHSTGGVQVGSNKKNPRVVVVAATNRPDLIDSALMRPGRIDKKIYVGPPDEGSRHRILEIGLRERNCADDIDVSSPRFTF
jgi:SpoVK/Ycf46/Vps4 family AAA+-type ATPase